MPTKTPQDHKTTKTAQDAEKQQSFADVEGHKLLEPFSKVKGSDQARLTGRLVRLGLLDESGDSEGVDLESLDFDAVADLIDYVSEHFAIDSAKFDTFTMGPGGMERAMNLAVAYAGEMGKDDA
ncbi:hypothetical protein DEO23_14020 [Brachybacterium endophyticum]|uniref:Uncharacterized protein n=1 Tax=Brachybacterium endophyticum TaxID=2182385 RepID=A0A2U2RH43_9MICO|nr:hypothetical protein [Brachybacterium endophyticum]PWH05193.1 hypothetical protein DEO23_14020 [Brachybacterium endophyticum]